MPLKTAPGRRHHHAGRQRNPSNRADGTFLIRPDRTGSPGHTVSPVPEQVIGTRKGSEPVLIKLAPIKPKALI